MQSSESTKFIITSYHSRFIFNFFPIFNEDLHKHFCVQCDTANDPPLILALKQLLIAPNY